MFWSDLTVANSILYSKFFLNFTISLLSANIFPHAWFNVGSSISDAKSKNYGGGGKDMKTNYAEIKPYCGSLLNTNMLSLLMTNCW